MSPDQPVPEREKVRELRDKIYATVRSAETQRADSARWFVRAEQLFAEYDALLSASAPRGGECAKCGDDSCRGVKMVTVCERCASRLAAPTGVPPQAEPLDRPATRRVINAVLEAIEAERISTARGVEVIEEWLGGGRGLSVSEYLAAFDLWNTLDAGVPQDGGERCKCGWSESAWEGMRRFNVCDMCDRANPALAATPPAERCRTRINVTGDPIQRRCDQPAVRDGLCAKHAPPAEAGEPRTWVEQNASAIITEQEQHIARLEAELADADAALKATTVRHGHEVDSFTQRIAALEAELRDWEEREASVCPEDVGFPEYIATLTAELARVREDAARMDAVVKAASAYINACWMDDARRHQQGCWERLEEKVNEYNARTPRPDADTGETT